jgi:MFS family permease
MDTVANKEKGKFHYSYLIVVACCVMCLLPAAIIFSCSGIFYTPVSTDLGVGKGVFALYMTFISLSMSLSIPFTSKIVAARDLRVVLTVAVLMVGCSLIAMSRFTSVYMFYGAGILIGIAESVFYFLAVPTLINRWFFKNVGFMIGFSFAFTGLGGVLFNPLGVYFITNYGWRSAYLAFGIIILVVTLPFTLFVIRNYPKDVGLLPYGDPGTKSEEGKAPVATKAKGVSANIARRTPAFLLVAVFASCVNISLQIYGYMPSFAESLNLGTSLIAGIVSSAMLGTIVGKLGLGFISDKNVMAGTVSACLCGIAGIGMLTTMANSSAIVLTAAFIFGIYYAIGAVHMPIMVRSIFGSREYTLIYGSVATVSSLSTAISASLWGFVIDATGGYTAMLVGALILTVLATVIGVLSIKSSKNLVHTID